MTNDSLEHPIASAYALRAIVDSAYSVGYRAGARGVQQARNVIAAEIRRASADMSYGIAQRRALERVAGVLNEDAPVVDDTTLVSWEPQYGLLYISDGPPVLADNHELAPFVCVRVSRDSGRVVGLEVADMHGLFDYLRTCLDAADAKRAVTPAASEAQK